MGFLGHCKLLSRLNCDPTHVILKNMHLANSGQNYKLFFGNFEILQIFILLEFPTFSRQFMHTFVQRFDLLDYKMHL